MIAPAFTSQGYLYCKCCEKNLGATIHDPDPHYTTDCLLKFRDENSILWDRIQELESRLDKLEKDRE
jgi:hypothetical protein